MKKQYRIKKSSEIELILKNKLSYGNKYFTVYKKENLETKNFRYAISAGKKIGNAVVRNKVKRQVRSILNEICDKEYILDVFIIVKPNVLSIEYIEMKKQLTYLFKKNKIKLKGE